MSDDEFYSELCELLCMEYTNTHLSLYAPGDLRFREAYIGILRKTTYVRWRLEAMYGSLNLEERQEHLVKLRLEILFGE